MLRAAAGDDNREMEKSYSCFPESPDQLKHRFPWGRRGKSSLQTHHPMRLIKGSSITVKANNSGESSDKPSSGRQSLAALPSRLSPAPAPAEREQGGKAKPMVGKSRSVMAREPAGGDQQSPKYPCGHAEHPRGDECAGWAGKRLAGDVVAFCCSMSRIF